MMVSDQKSEAVPEKKGDIDIVRSDDFRLIYANNVVSEGSAWDLRFTFGHFENDPSGRSINELQAVVTIPFGVAKLMLYWVEAAILAHELETGHRIGIRESLLPPEPPPLTPEDSKNPIIVKYRTALTGLRERFLSTLLQSD